jgi:PRTRC genetic system protein B
MNVATNSSVSIPTVSEQLMPISAFVFYGYDDKTCQAVTRHSVVNNRLSSPTLLRSEDVNALLMEITDTSDGKTLAPANVLKNTPTHIVWYTKRMTRLMWFRTSSGVKSYLVEWCPLLWISTKDGNSCHIMALGSNVRPSGKSRLFIPPLMNISSSGSLCQGTARIPNAVTYDSLVDVQNTVFDSCFSHVNTDKTLKGKNVSNTKHIKFWQEKSKTKSRVRTKELNFSMTVDEYLKGKI